MAVATKGEPGLPASHVRHRAKYAVLLIDVLNHFEFSDGKLLLRNALPLAPRLRRLKRLAQRSNVPVIYVNDNFGQWRSDASKLVAYCMRSKCTGGQFVEAIRPGLRDYCVLKPMHSAFYQTPLELLLKQLGASSLLIAGLATNSCILCCAHGAKRCRDSLWRQVSATEDSASTNGSKHDWRTLAHLHSYTCA
jgi:nicotinamidase-related amidase